MNIGHQQRGVGFPEEGEDLKFEVPECWIGFFAHNYYLDSI